MPDQDPGKTPATGLPATPAPGAPPLPPASAQPVSKPQGVEQRVGAPGTHLPPLGDALSNLAHLIPGFAGYKAVEDRRIADKQLRATIGERLSAIKGRLDAIVDGITRGGSLDGPSLVDLSGRRLEKLIDRMRFADYGYSAVFDRVQLGEPELAKLYQYDIGIMNELGSFDSAMQGVEAAAGDPAKLQLALATLDALTAEFDRRFEARQHLFDPLTAPQS